MQRRCLLGGLAAGMALLAGCNGNGGGGGNNTTQSTNGGGTSLTSGSSGTSTPAATTMAETTGETATTTSNPTSMLETETPSNTAIPTAESTAVETGGLDTATDWGMAEVNLSEREMYSNETYSYTIEYPVGWAIVDSDPAYVSFIRNTDDVYVEGGSLNVVVEESPSETTLDQATERVLRNYLSGEGEDDDAQTLNRQDVTLPNGNPGKLYDFRLDRSGTSTRQKAFLTLVSDTLYGVTIFLPEAAYSSSVDQEAEDIITSLTISDKPIGTETG